MPVVPPSETGESPKTKGESKMNVNFSEIAQEAIRINEAKIYEALMNRFADYLDEYAIAEAIMPCPSEIESLLAEAAIAYFSS